MYCYIGALNAYSLLWDKLMNIMPSSLGGNNNKSWNTVATTSSLSAIASSIASHLPRKSHAKSIDIINVGSLNTTLLSIKPIKTGWLLKKRDVWNAWRCRYFVVYPGKLAYYTDQHDPQPKAIISITSENTKMQLATRANIYAEKQCTINGNHEHWYLM